MKIDLGSHGGTFRKSATVYSNDPKKPRINLIMQGKLRPLIEIRPAGAVSFRGLADQVGAKVINILATSQPFQIQKLESNLEDSIDYRLEAIENGKHYRLTVDNRVKEGSYGGFIKGYTDLAQRPEIFIRVAGNIEGEIAVRPQSLLVGKLNSDQPARVGKVVVLNNRKEAFRITRLTYDERLLEVIQEPLPGRAGFSLEIAPKLDNIPKGGQRQQALLTIQTDVSPDARHEVKVYLIHM